MTFFCFFFESTCACVLGPWPRAFLSLASRVSVLGKTVLGLSLGFFLCPWPWPGALCPRLHLCELELKTKDNAISDECNCCDLLKFRQNSFIGKTCYMQLLITALAAVTQFSLSNNVTRTFFKLRDNL